MGGCVEHRLWRRTVHLPLTCRLWEVPALYDTEDVTVTSTASADVSTHSVPSQRKRYVRATKSMSPRDIETSTPNTSALSVVATLSTPINVAPSSNRPGVARRELVSGVSASAWRHGRHRGVVALGIHALEPSRIADPNRQIRRHNRHFRDDPLSAHPRSETGCGPKCCDPRGTPWLLRSGSEFGAIGWAP